MDPHDPNKDREAAEARGPGDQTSTAHDDALQAAYRRVRSAVQAVSGPELDGGAATRIADGAWARAHGAESESAQESARRSLQAASTRTRWSRLGRSAGLAAAAVLVIALVFGVQGPDNAFAVEGDPVDVHDGAAWTRATAIRDGQFVHAPSGARELTTRDGSRLVPEPGAVFRVVEVDGPQSFRIEVLRGAVEAEGPRLFVQAGDVVARRDLGEPRISVRVSMRGADDISVAAPPADLRRLPDERDLLPLVEALRNRVMLSVRGSGEKLRLRRHETASVEAGAGDSTTPRLALLEEFDTAVAAQLLSDVATGMGQVFDARADGVGVRIVLVDGRDRLRSVQVPSDQDAFVATLNELTTNQLTSGSFATFGAAISIRMGGRDGPGSEASVHTTIQGLPWLPSGALGGPPERRFSLERDGRELRVDVSASGAVLVVDGKQARRFASLTALHDEAPDLAARFGGRLPRE